MNNKILNSIANAIDNKEDLRKRLENNKQVLQDLLNSVQTCQNKYGGKSELATEDDIRIIKLCENWEKVLSHGIKTNLSNSTIQNLVTVGLNFTLNNVNVGNSLWSYTCVHLTKHEKERFIILSNINTPLGYFRAFLRAALNERSLDRYLQSWIAHGLLLEYYEEGSISRDPETCHLLPTMAAGLSSILFALSIDRTSLNELQPNQINKTEHVIPLPTPVKSSGNIKRRPLRQVISFDKKDKNIDVKTATGKEDTSWFSAPATCLNSPDPKTIQTASNSEPTSSDCKSGLRHFFPDGVRSMESPSQILSKLSECAKEIFSSSNSIDRNNIISDYSDLSVTNLKISESDSEEIASSINGSTSCLELCFTEDESVHEYPGETNLDRVIEVKQKDFLNLQTKFEQMEIVYKEKIQKLEKVILDLSKENGKLKDQLRQYMSAVEMGKAIRNDPENNEEITQYERKLIQVAEMHAELMEFNQHLQRRLQDVEFRDSRSSQVDRADYCGSNVKVYIPSTFLVQNKTQSYHIYQVFVKIGQEEWSVYHRYSEFYQLYIFLKKCHPDIGSCKFPPKKTLGKRKAELVAVRRMALQRFLRTALSGVPALRGCTSRAQLVALLPFLGTSTENDSTHILKNRQDTPTL